MEQKRKKQQQQEASGKAAKKYKEFKFWHFAKSVDVTMSTDLTSAMMLCVTVCARI